MTDTSPVLDVPAYVDDFNTSVIDGYRPAWRTWSCPATRRRPQHHPAGDGGDARLLGLAPQIPEFIAEACVGCMACVTACPDTAILGIAQPGSVVEPARSGMFAARQPDPDLAAATARSHFVRPPSTATSRRKRGLEPALFGIFVDPVHCKGCAECVEVCHALDHDALRMTDKVPVEPAGESTLDRFAPRHALLPLAAVHAGRLSQREGAGRHDARRARPWLRRRCRLVLRLRRGDGRPDARGRDRQLARSGLDGASWRPPAATRSTPRPTRTTRTSCPGPTRCSRTRRPTRSAIRARWDQMGWRTSRLWCIGGDGAMFDIGFQSLSRMVASGVDIKVLVLDTQVYSNTGGQASTASFTGQITKLSAFGTVDSRPRRSAARSSAASWSAHGNVYVAQSTPGPPQPLLPGRHGGQRVPRPGGDRRLHALHARARHRR